MVKLCCSMRGIRIHLTLLALVLSLVTAASLALTASAQTSSIDYPNFSSTSGLQLTGNATQQGDVLRLTSAGRSGWGSAWYDTTQDIANGFTTTFDFQITDRRNDGADGLGFHVHNDTLNTVASHHGAEIDGKHLSVIFDTWKNFPESSDPSDNFVQIRFGDGSTAPIVGEKDLNPLGITLDDGQVHTVTIEYADNAVKVSIDGTEVVSANNIDLASISPATVGFGAFGGFATENHDILRWTFDAVTVPTSADQCKNDGWKNYSKLGFKNQGDCVSYVKTHGKNEPGKNEPNE